MASTSGQSGKPFDMAIEAGKVREFARATRSHNPDYQRPTGPAPVTFLMSSEFWTGPDNAPWGDSPPSFERLLHGEQEFVFPGAPPQVGDQLTGVVRIDKIYTKEGGRGGTMTFIETVTEYRRQGTAAIVAEVRSTLIQTSKPAT
jgi:N-terminal half of MaoC dehydratase